MPELKRFFPSNVFPKTGDSSKSMEYFDILLKATKKISNVILRGGLAIKSEASAASSETQKVRKNRVRKSKSHRCYIHL